MEPIISRPQKMTVSEVINLVIQLLEHVSVEGRKNVLNLANAIGHLEAVQNTLANQPESKSEEDE